MHANQVDLNQEHLFSAIEQSLAMILFDPTGKILNANDNFAHVVGYSKEELSNMHHRELCLDTFTSSHDYTVFWRNLRDNKAFNNKVERVKKDGNILWLEAMYTPVINEAGQVEGVIKIASDITNQEMIIKNSSEEFMALVEEMTASTNEVHHASQQSVNDMGKLQEESQIVRDYVDKIGTIAITVKDLATQSNLLGLNASIEAARAGEQGAGFSVVASEIRKMSDSSKSSAEEISKQLEQITDSVSNTVEMIKQVTDQINDNSVVIEELKNAYEHVTKTAEELSSII